MKLEEFIDALYAAGWTAPYDAQWTQISGVHAALIARAEAAEAEVARLREALELAEAEVERLLSELSDAVDGHWDAEPSWYADKALTASPYADGAYDNTTE